MNFPKKSGDDDQLERFKALARQLGCDEDKARTSFEFISAAAFGECCHGGLSGRSITAAAATSVAFTEFPRQLVSGCHFLDKPM
jgi:hypothetical protein